LNKAGLLRNAVNQLLIRNSSSYNEADARAHLGKFGGGSIDLLFDHDTGMASLVLNRPEKKNALSGSMMVELSDAVTELEKWKEGKSVAVYGAGNTFCSGADLDLVQQNLDPKEGMFFSQYMQSVLTRLNQLPLISAALVQGQALGGGSELLTSTDFRVASEKVSMGFLQSKLGVTTGFGGGTRLVKLLGRRTALELISSARVLSWKEGLDIGFVDAVLPNNEHFIDAGKDWLLDHTIGTAQVIQATKRMVVAVETAPLMTDALAQEAEIFRSVWGGTQHREFMAKGQKPNLKIKK